MFRNASLAASCALVLIAASGLAQTKARPQPKATSRPRREPAPPVVVPIAGMDAACEKATGERGRPEALSRGVIQPGAILPLFEGDGGWDWRTSYAFPFLRAADAETVKTLVCVSQTYSEAGAYTDGADALRRVWQVRVVRWPEGIPLAATTLAGGDPPQSKARIPGEGIGGPPSERLLDWLWQGVDDKTLFLEPDEITAMAYAPGSGLLTLSSAGRVTLRNIKTGEAVRSFAINLRAGQPSLALSADGSSVAVASSHGVPSSWGVRLFDVATGRQQLSLDALTRTEPVGVAFSREGRTLATVSYDGRARLWGLPEGTQTRTRETNGSVSVQTPIAFSPADDAVAIGSYGAVQLWKLASDDLLKLPLQGGNVTGLRFLGDGRRLAIAYYRKDGGGGRVAVWDIAQQRELAAFDGPLGGVHSVAIDPTGLVLAFESSHMTVGLWDIATGRACGLLRGHEVWGGAGGIVGLEFFDRNTLASAGKDRIVKFWDVSQMCR